jgi:hypothetical protein
VKAYLLGGLAWFSIPFGFATTMGLSAVALRGDPSMIALSPGDISAGLPGMSQYVVPNFRQKISHFL